jgi:predicted GIY-YIG superfamily endonuclease
MTIYHIYGLYNEEHTGTYIGHTKDLEERLRGHKKIAMTSNRKVYKYMREVGGEWQMHVLETHECTKKYAIERERYYKDLVGDLNTEVPGREKPEYDKTWYKNNPEKVKAKNDKRKLERYTCQCGSNLRWSDRRQHEKSAKHIAYETQN